MFRETDMGQRIARVLARLRGMAPPPRRCPLGRRGGGRPHGAGRGRLDDGGVLGGRSSMPCRRRPGRAALLGPARGAVPRRDPVQLAARGDHRPLRGGRRLDAVARGDRRVAAGRHDQAPSGDLRGGARRRSATRAGGDPARRRRLGGGRRRGAAGRLARGLPASPAGATRRCRAARRDDRGDPDARAGPRAGGDARRAWRPALDRRCVGRLAADGAPRPPRQPRAARRGRRGVDPRRHPRHDARPVPGRDGRATSARC